MGTACSTMVDLRASWEIDLYLLIEIGSFRVSWRRHLPRDAGPSIYLDYSPALPVRVHSPLSVTASLPCAGQTNRRFVSVVLSGIWHIFTEYPDEMNDILPISGFLRHRCINIRSAILRSLTNLLELSESYSFCSTDVKILWWIHKYMHTCIFVQKFTHIYIGRNDYVKISL